MSNFIFGKNLRLKIDFRQRTSSKVFQNSFNWKQALGNQAHSNTALKLLLVKDKFNIKKTQNRTPQKGKIDEL